MSKELKAPDKVTQKMTRDGAVAENLTTGETSSISERPQEENYSAPAGVAAEKVVQHIGAEIERHAAKGAEKKALDATQPKTHSSRLQFSEAERATPELQKAIKKSDKAADCLDAARAAIPKQTKIKKERVFDEAKGKAIVPPFAVSPAAMRNPKSSNQTAYFAPSISKPFPPVPYSFFTNSVYSSGVFSTIKL